MLIVGASVLRVSNIVSNAHANMSASTLVCRNGLFLECRKYQNVISEIYTCQAIWIERNNLTFDNSRWEEQKGHQTFWFELLDYAQNAWEKVHTKMA